MQGKINLSASKQVLQSYKPRASVLPAEIDFTDCPYMWPYCGQPVYAGAQPVIFNATVLNGMGVWGNISQPQWVANDVGGALLDVLFETSDVLWPWSGHLSLFISVKGEGAEYSGQASGTVQFTVQSPPRRGSTVCPLCIVSSGALQPVIAVAAWCRKQSSCCLAGAAGVL
jgi:membrane-bound transcription factor site-1 protease